MTSKFSKSSQMPRGFTTSCTCQDRRYFCIIPVAEHYWCSKWMEHLICVASPAGSVDINYDFYTKPVKAQLENLVTFEESISLISPVYRTGFSIRNNSQWGQIVESLEEPSRACEPLQITEVHVRLFWTKWVTWSKTCLGKVNLAMVCRMFTLIYDKKIGV